MGDPSAIGAAFTGLAMHGGADAPESGTVALFEIGRGAGGTWTSAAGSFSIPAPSCDPDRRPGPCFRYGALPIVLHFTESCHHNGPVGSDPACDAYTGFDPPLADFDAAAGQLRGIGARYVGLNTSGEPCASATSPISPCRYLADMADATETEDFEGNPWSFDLPMAPTARVFEDTVIAAIDAAVNGTRLDVSVGLRDDPGDAVAVDATRFVQAFGPACTGAPGDRDCWTPPPGIDHDDAVRSVDIYTFFGVVPGTNVRFDMTLRNELFDPDSQLHVFVAYVDLATTSAVLLETHRIFIVVPPGIRFP
jgi:hypothetical protein